MIFKSFIIKFNRKGVGLIYLPNDHQNVYTTGTQLRVTVNTQFNKVIFYAKLRLHNKLGIYVPRSIMNKYNLIFKEAIISLEEVDGFFTKIGEDGRIYLPNQEAKKLNLKQNEIVLIKGIIEDKPYIEFCQVKIRKKQTTIEYMCMFNTKLAKKEGIFKILEILSRKDIQISKEFKELIKDFNYAPINKDTVVAYFGLRVPIVIRINFNLMNVSYYLGCYFADGTKKGNSWGICASTFEQANYFKEMHNHLIPDNKLELSLTMTLNDGAEKSVKNIVKLWEKNCKTKINHNRIRLYFSKSEPYTNRNKFGTLVIKEHRQLVMIYYNMLIKHLLDTIKKENNSVLAQKFVCGVMEGDGCLNARGRAHIQITTNQTEVKIFEEFLKYSGLKFRKHKEKTGKIYVNVNGMGIIENLDKLKNILFKYYPKRRRIFCERLCDTPVVKFLTGKQTTTSYWILKRFRKNGILNKNNELTTKGKNIKEALLELESELIK